ncbi:MAG: hypothetical protein H7Y61_04905 [Rhizobiales bacterium]|nr:hypothetical protein [Rhizobacter sp.]
MWVIWRFFFVSLLAVGGAGTVSAQSGDGLTLLPADSALACLDTGGSKKPVYPEREVALRTEATVRVSLTFVAPDRPPKLQTTYNSGSDAFIEAVESFVNSYRLPCMAPGAPPIVGVQEFQFVPHDGRKVIHGALRDGRPYDPQAFRCVKGMRPPQYPASLNRPPEGTVVVKMRFVDGTSAPQPEVLFNGGSDRLAAAVLAAVEQYRMPCLGASDAPVTALQTFRFVMSDSKRWALKDVELRQFVAAIDKLQQNQVRFDFSTMGCPFDVRLRLFQPHAPNEVGELERSDPNRREFIEWLRKVSLKLPGDAARQVIGQSITISVPCGVLDLI